MAVNHQHQSKTDINSTKSRISWPLFQWGRVFLFHFHTMHNHHSLLHWPDLRKAIYSDLVTACRACKSYINTSKAGKTAILFFFFFSNSKIPFCSLHQCHACYLDASSRTSFVANLHFLKWSCLNSHVVHTASCIKNCNLKKCSCCPTI